MAHKTYIFRQDNQSNLPIKLCAPNLRIRANPCEPVHCHGHDQFNIDCDNIVPAFEGFKVSKQVPRLSITQMREAFLKKCQFWIVQPEIRRGSEKWCTVSKYPFSCLKSPRLYGTVPKLHQHSVTIKYSIQYAETLLLDPGHLGHEVHYLNC